MKRCFVKILYRIIPCNRFLKQICIKQNDSCDYCNSQDQDTIEHFLLYCPKVQALWSQFCSWFDREANIDLKVSPEEYLLGVLYTRHNVKVVNTLILYFKFYVYRQKLFYNCDLKLLSLLSEVKNKIKTEKLMCTIQHKDSHFNKWKSILLALG